MIKQNNALEIINILRNKITNPVCELNFNNVFELLIAVILSAQCTDSRVNIVTKELFKRYKTPEDFVNCNLIDLENSIKTCGFYKNKAKNIVKCCEVLINKFNSKVPKTMDELISLPGVGRKTASVVLAVGYGIPAIPVDTHLFRLAKRLGFYSGNNVFECENAYKELIPEDLWIDAHHLILLFGRYYCKAINPKCNNCELKKFCCKNKGV